MHATDGRNKGSSQLLCREEFRCMDRRAIRWLLKGVAVLRFFSLENLDPPQDF
jgi:hypothetical protein